jgi:hypothetical protein
MRKLAALTLSLFLTSGMALADSPKDADAPPAKTAEAAKPKAAKKAEKADANFAAELESLKQAIQAQQEQLEMLKEELGKRDRQIDAAREEAAAANARAAEATTKAAEAVNTTAEVKTTAATLSSSVSDLKVSNDSLKVSNEALKSTVAAVNSNSTNGQGAGSSEDGPASIKFKGITITPGGFLAAETVFRNRATSADINTPFTGIPFNGSDLSKVTEFNFTGRQSRITLLAEGKAKSVTLQGYYEADFLGTGVTSNNRQSNSYVLRQRQVFARARFDNGFAITGGQMWSLATETKKLLDNRTEALPMTIDPQYNVGFTWERQYGFRITKDFGKDVALGFSIEAPQLTIGGRGFPANFFVNAQGAGGGLYNFVDTTGYSVNKTPDFIVKAAFEPGWGHYEVFGMISTYRERNYPCATTAATAVCNGVTGPNANGAFNDSRTGGGIGVNARVPLLNKKLDAGIHVLGGDGVGRYGSAQLADVTARPDGTLSPIRGGSALGTLEAHPNKALDIYANLGFEYAYRTAYTGATPTVGVGYGSPLFNNSGCNKEVVPGPNPSPAVVPAGTLSPGNAAACAGDIRNIGEGTLGFWHRIYSGPKGRLQWGLQYSYLFKNTWSGNNGVPTAVGSAPNAHDNMVWTSFRYYIP